MEARASREEQHEKMKVKKFFFFRFTESAESSLIRMNLFGFLQNGPPPSWFYNKVLSSLYF